MHSSVALQRQQRQPPLNDIHRLLEKVIKRVIVKGTLFFDILFYSVSFLLDLECK